MPFGRFYLSCLFADGYHLFRIFSSPALVSATAILMCFCGKIYFGVGLIWKSFTRLFQEKNGCNSCFFYSWQTACCSSQYLYIYNRLLVGKTRKAEYRPHSLSARVTFCFGWYRNGFSSVLISVEVKLSRKNCSSLLSSDSRALLKRISLEILHCNRCWFHIMASSKFKHSSVNFRVIYCGKWSHIGPNLNLQILKRNLRTFTAKYSLSPGV